MSDAEQQSVIHVRNALKLLGARGEVRRLDDSRRSSALRVSHNLRRAPAHHRWACGRDQRLNGRKEPVTIQLWARTGRAGLLALGLHEREPDNHPPATP